MAEVVLIGDSIRMGYQESVRQELEGEATLWEPKENGGTSANVLAHLDEWVLSRQPTVVHLNCGLHDLKKDFDAEQCNIPLEQYRANLEAIFESIQTRSESRLIWAMTTPVNEKWHHERKGFDRFEADVAAYNAAALELAGRYDVPIDDLFEVVMRAGRDEHLSPDGVHFTEAGSKLLGKAVAEAIRKLLCE